MDEQSGDMNMGNKALRAVISALLSASLTACQSQSDSAGDSIEQGISAIENAMTTKADSETLTPAENTDDLRAGTSEDTVAAPDDLPAEYDYGSGKISDYSRDNMMRKLPAPSGNQTVLNTAEDPENVQVLYLWEEGNVPAKTSFTEDMAGYFDEWDFRPYVTAIPVRKGVQPKGAVVLMAGGAYQFRGNYTDSLPTAAALRSWDFRRLSWITACTRTLRRRARLTLQGLSVSSARMRRFTVSTPMI